MAQYNIKTLDGYSYVINADNEEAAMISVAKKMGRLPIDPLSKYVVYSNIDRECRCSICELDLKCMHSGCFRRLPKRMGGSDECPKLKKIN